MGNNTNRADERDGLLDEIEKLELSHGAIGVKRLPETTLDELSYKPPTNAELKLAAENELAEYRKAELAGLRAKSEAEMQSLSDRRDAYAAGRAGERDKLQRQYKESARAIDNDIIRRGLARSSVAVVERGELERELMARTADIEAGYGKILSRIDADIASAGAKLTSALNDFNISYAVKLNQKLNELKIERDRAMNEATKYNNEVRKTQAQLDGDRAKTESALYSEALSQRAKEGKLDSVSPERRDEIYKAVYDRMDAFLGAMTPQQALLEIRNHTLYRQHLSNYYYDKLYAKYGKGELDARAN